MCAAGAEGGESRWRSRSDAGPAGRRACQVEGRGGSGGDGVGERFSEAREGIGTNKQYSGGQVQQSGGGGCAAALRVDLGEAFAGRDLSLDLSMDKNTDLSMDLMTDLTGPGSAHGSERPPAHLRGVDLSYLAIVKALSTYCGWACCAAAFRVGRRRR